MDNSDYGVDESGSSLRQKLEETLEENRRITTELSGLKASSLIEEHGYGLVKLEDLDGVALDEMADTALKLQEERQVQQVDLARDMLARRGLDGADLDKAVEDFLAPAGTNVSSAAHGRVKATSAIGGTAAPLRDTSTLVGLDAIEAGLREKT